MKTRLTLSAILILLSGFFQTTQSQCTVVPQSAPGFYPGTTQGIHPAAATGPYSLNLTVVIPKDTVISPLPRFNIDSATVKAFIGFPASFQYNYYPASQWIRGDSAGCILISGVPSTADIGIHNISLVYTAMVIGFAYTDTLENFWQFEVKDSSQIGFKTPESDQATLQVYPNPASADLFITASQSFESEVILYQASGILVNRFNHAFKPGTPLHISTGALAPGLYFISIHEPSGLSVRKVVITE